MWTVLLSAVPAITNLLSGSGSAASSAMSGAAALCQAQLADADSFSKRMVSQRNAALALTAVAFFGGFWIGRKSK